MEFLNDPNTVWKYKEAIMSKVCILDIVKEYNIKVEEKSAGDFTHRVFCPFHRGKNGDIERTPSMFLSTKTQSFCCFGCFKSGSVIEFISFMDGTPNVISLTKLAKRVGIIDKDGNFDELNLSAISYDIIEPQKNIDPFLVDIGVSLRNYLKSFSGEDFTKEFKWVEKVSKRVDEYMSNIGYEDWEYAKDLCDKVKKSIKNRKKR